MSASEDVVAALSRKGTQPGEGGGDNLAGELEKVKHTADMWAGRAKQIAQENAELKEKLRKLEAGSGAKAVVEKLTPEQLGDLPKEYAETILGASSQMMQAAQEKQEAELKAMRAEIEEGNRKVFLAQIGARHEQFFDLVKPGGANAKIWEEFKEAHKETFEGIMTSHDSGRFDRFVSDFCRVYGVSDPSGAKATTTTPDPVTTGGGKQVVQTNDKKVYTPEEYAELEKKLMRLRATNYQEYLKMRDEVEQILIENRIREQ